MVWYRGQHVCRSLSLCCFLLAVVVAIHCSREMSVKMVCDVTVRDGPGWKKTIGPSGPARRGNFSLANGKPGDEQSCTNGMV